MKERLTGAIILVALIVLLVPELLTGPKGRSAAAPANTATAGSEELPLRSYTINLGDESHSRAAAAGNSGPGMAQGGPEQPPTSSEQGSPASELPSTAQASAAEQAASQASTGQAPAGQAPAGQAPAGQAPAGQSPTSQQTPTVAPHPASRESKSAHASKAAAAAASKAAKSAQHSNTANSSVASNSAAAKHNQAADSVSKPESRWAVQLGVFSSRANADRLAVEVRAKGFNVGVSPATSKGHKVYRVRVGPAADRAAAQDLQARLKAAGRPGGTVVPYS